MKRILVYLAFIYVLFPFAVTAQTSRVLPWNPSNSTDGQRVYIPEPVLFVHGINDNDEGWERYGIWYAGIPCTTNYLTTPGVLPQLENYFSSYWVPFDASALIAADQSNGLYRATQRNYLHTFNYGDQRGTNTHNRQAYDKIAWNAWSQDRDYLPYTNTYLKPPTNQWAGDLRITLDERISADDVGIRPAYQADPNAPDTQPKVVIVAHSLGGLLSHYYMLKSGESNGVRRLITLATPHQGSHYANWLTSYFRDPMGTMVNMTNPYWFKQAVALTGAAACGRTAGYFLHGTRGAVNDAVVVGATPIGTGLANFPNPLMDYFWDTPAPKIEYVFNLYQRGPITGYVFLKTGTSNAAPSEAVEGDGFVAPWSAAGKSFKNTPSIWNGATNVNPNIHDIDPVIFGKWPDTDHSDAGHHVESILCSLAGVPYRWPSNTPNLRPPLYLDNWPFTYARYYDENQSFSKYLPVSDATGTHSDEPGIGALVPLYNRAGQNPLLISTRSTWAITNDWFYGDIWNKHRTNSTDRIGCQIIGQTSGGTAQIYATVGTKNLSATPFMLVGTNVWPVDGNEYLPRSVNLKIDIATAPVPEDDFFHQTAGGWPLDCLVYLDAVGLPQHQYGLLNPDNHPSIATLPLVSGRNFVAAQGQNLAGLLTPQAERAFDVPIDSATVVAILKKINQGEALSNECVSPATPTRWQQTVSEWINVNTNTGTFALNFFPTSSMPTVMDAWTRANYSEWTFNPTNKTVTLTNVVNAPSQLLVSNTVFLGCAETFTNAFGGVVGSLTDDSLAGVPINEAFLNQMRTSLSNIVAKYAVTACGTNWVFTNLLIAAGYPTGAWSNVVNGLLLPVHFTQVSNVAARLTHQYSAFTLAASGSLATNNVFHLTEGWFGVAYSNQISAGSCLSATLSMTAGALPAGLTLTNVTDTAASLTGTPTTAGTNSFVITVTDTNGCSTNQLFSLVIQALCRQNWCSPSIATNSYSFSVTASTGSPLDTQLGGNAYTGTFASADGCTWTAFYTNLYQDIQYSYCPCPPPSCNSCTAAEAMAACLTNPGTCTDNPAGGGTGVVINHRPDPQYSYLSWSGSNWEVQLAIAMPFYIDYYPFTGGTDPCDPTGTYTDSAGDTLDVQ